MAVKRFHNIKYACLCLLILSSPVYSVTVGIPEGMGENVINIKNGKVYGAFSALANCIENRLNITFKWSFYPTKRLFLKLQNNELDMLYPMGFTQERNDIAQPSTPSFIDEDYWIYMGKKPDFSDKELAIAVKLGSPQEDILKAMGYKNLSLLRYASILKVLASGRAEVAMLPSGIFFGLAEGNTEFKADLFVRREVGFYLSQSYSAKYLSKINDAINRCK